MIIHLHAALFYDNSYCALHCSKIIAALFYDNSFTLHALEAVLNTAAGVFLCRYFFIVLRFLCTRRRPAGVTNVRRFGDAVLCAGTSS
jgi:hypothetical protein